MTSFLDCFCLATVNTQVYNIKAFYNYVDVKLKPIKNYHISIHIEPTTRLGSDLTPPHLRWRMAKNRIIKYKHSFTNLKITENRNTKENIK